jgi:hypothetical protein
MSTLIETDGACPLNRAAKRPGKHTRVDAVIDDNKVHRRELANAKDAAKF